MMKLLGSALVILGCSYGGWAKGDKLKKQVQITSQFIQILSYIKREILQNHREIPVLLKRIDKTQQNIVGRYFRNLWLRLSADCRESVSEKWADICQEELSLSHGLLEILAPLEDILGQYDAKSQGEGLQYIIEELQQWRTKQEEEAGSMLRVYQALGITTGLFLVICFF